MPKNEDNEEIILKNKIPPTQIDDLDLYQILIEESRHLHSVWIDNFRIIITFNSILLAGAFTLLTIALKNEASTTATDVLPWALRTLALIGIVITIVGLHIFRRTKAITSLRHKELCYIEQIYKPISGVMPFNSGSVVLGEKGKKFPCSDSYPIILDRLKWNPMGGRGGYFLIGIAFLIAFVLVLSISFMKI